MIILGSWKPKDKQGLQTTLMITDGLKIESILYLCDINKKNILNLKLQILRNKISCCGC